MSRRFILIVILNILSSTLHAQIITTVAGNGSLFASGDGGPATAAAIHGPTTILIHTNENLFLVSHGEYIRKVDTYGIINIYAGGGIGGDGSLATAASLAGLRGGLAEDSVGNIYFTTSNQIRKINTANIVNTIAGSTLPGYSGDGGLASGARFALPGFLTFDRHGNMYVSTVRCIRKISTSGIVSSIQDLASSSSLVNPVIFK
jgi:hypothetical protein